MPCEVGGVIESVARVNIGHIGLLGLCPACGHREWVWFKVHDIERFLGDPDAPTPQRVNSTKSPKRSVAVYMQNGVWEK